MGRQRKRADLFISPLFLGITHLYCMRTVLLVFLLWPTLSFSEPDYRGEFFSWVWMPCLSQIAEDLGAVGEDVNRAALGLHGELQARYNTEARAIEDAVRHMSTEERSLAYKILRVECAGGPISEDYVPTWELGKPYG